MPHSHCFLFSALILSCILKLHASCCKGQSRHSGDRRSAWAPQQCQSIFIHAHRGSLFLLPGFHSSNEPLSRNGCLQYSNESLDIQMNDIKLSASPMTVFFCITWLMNPKLIPSSLFEIITFSLNSEAQMETKIFNCSAHQNQATKMFHARYPNGSTH